MGSVQSKGETGENPDSGILPPLCKFMSERYPGSLSQMQKWVDVGFPSNGSLSENQLKQLKVQLREMEKSGAAQHAALSRRKQKKNVIFKEDWEVFRMWKGESERRERQRLEEFKSLKSEESKKNATICSPIHPNAIYPCFPEVPGRSVEPDLDSAPPCSSSLRSPAVSSTRWATGDIQFVPCTTDDGL